MRMVEPGEVVLIRGHYTLIHEAPVRLIEKSAFESSRGSDRSGRTWTRHAPTLSRVGIGHCRSISSSVSASVPVL